MSTQTAADQLRAELAALPHQTGAAKTLARDAERLVSGKIGGAANTIVGVLFPGQPVPAAWWATPLGMFCAAAQDGGWRNRRVPRSEAAEILGVTPGTIAQLGARGDLAHDGGFDLGEVLDRLVRLKGDA